MEIGRWLRVEWDRVTAGVSAVLGGLVLVIGWFGVSSTPYPAEQIPYVLSSGLGGLFFLGVAATLWLSADLRDEWHKLDAIDRDMDALACGPTPGEPLGTIVPLDRTLEPSGSEVGTR